MGPYKSILTYESTILDWALKWHKLHQWATLTENLRAISTVFHNNNPFIEFSNFLTSVVEFNGEFENKKKQ